MFDFVAQVIQDFSHAKAIEKAGFLLALLSLPVASWLLGLFRLRNSRVFIDQLRQDNAILASERDGAERHAEAERSRAALWTPEAWMSVAKHEREQGNEEKAIAALRDGFERIREGMARTCLALAGHHLSLTVGKEPTEDLAEGERQARLATLLDPGDGDAAFLLEDVELIKAEGTDALIQIPGSFLPTDPLSAETTIDSIRELASRFTDSGRYRIGLRLYRRAWLIAQRAGLLQQRVGVLTTHDLAGSHWYCGNYADALMHVEVLISLLECNGRNDDPDLLDVKVLEARILNSFGDHHVALKKVKALLPLQERVHGIAHINSLMTRTLHVEILVNVGMYDEAFDTLTELLPLQERHLGADSEVALVTRTLEVVVLERLGQHRLALEKVTELLSLQERFFGTEHPHLHFTRFLKVEILDDVGEHRQALDEIGAILSDMEGNTGRHHPNLLVARGMEANILDHLGDHRGAFEKISAVLKLQKQFVRPENISVLTNRLEEAEILHHLGEHQAALDKLTALLPDLRRFLGADTSAVLSARSLEIEAAMALRRFEGAVAALEQIIEEEVQQNARQEAPPLRTRLVLAEALAAEGHKTRALSELNVVIEFLEQNCAPSHFLLQRALASQQRLLGIPASGS